LSIISQPQLFRRPLFVRFLEQNVLVGVALGRIIRLFLIGCGEGNLRSTGRITDGAEAWVVGRTEGSSACVTEATTASAEK
jgi:hypothetical protein